jgi:hypothetical protein
MQEIKMLGICPNCRIRLKDPPFNGRDTNEVMLVIRYREAVENGSMLRSIDDIGYCELCNAKKEDLEKQKE